MTRDELLSRMAVAYYEYLNAIVPVIKKDPLIAKGIKEGLNKFLTNCCIALVGKTETDYYSPAALEIIKNKKKLAGLVYEHMIPKNIYQDKIVKNFIEGKIKSAEDIKTVLDQYWYIALITKHEDKLLFPQRSMLETWDSKNILARYSMVKVIPRKECRQEEF